MMTARIYVNLLEGKSTAKALGRCKQPWLWLSVEPNPLIFSSWEWDVLSDMKMNDQVPKESWACEAWVLKQATLLGCCPACCKVMYFICSYSCYMAICRPLNN